MTTAHPKPCPDDTVPPPQVGQIWRIEESVFSPVAAFLGANMPNLMSASVTSFGDDRSSKMRPCLVFEKQGQSFEVYLFATFEGGKTNRIPAALKYFLAEVDPLLRPSSDSALSLPCFHSSPRWTYHPQYIVALPHKTSPQAADGYGKGRVLNHLDRPWTANSIRCKHLLKECCDLCLTFEFVESQRTALNEFSMRKKRLFSQKTEREQATMSKQFRNCLNGKIRARARDNADGSLRSIGSAMSEVSNVSQTSSRKDDRSALTPRSTVFDQRSMAPRYPPSMHSHASRPSPLNPHRNHRSGSPTNSSSSESEPELQTPALPSAELPSPLVKGIAMLSIDADAASSYSNGAHDLRSPASDVVTPKYSTFRGIKTAGTPRTPTASLRGATRPVARFYENAIHTISGKRKGDKASQEDEWPTLPTSPVSPVTPTKHRRHDSKASTSRGV
ncbi:unnamed protein product [Peniophora sp. CBMAI 1063]|nr:unnamed protein product [Peniophora sp. CBMAI 1063]